MNLDILIFLGYLLYGFCTPEQSEPLKLQFIIDQNTIVVLRTIMHDQQTEFTTAIRIADPKATLPYGITLIHFAIQERQYLYGIELIKQGWIPTQKDREFTALMADLETDEKKADAIHLLEFLEQQLHDTSAQIGQSRRAPKRIPRPILDYELPQNHALFAATVRNDAAQMSRIIDDLHANPNARINCARPMTIAIAGSHEDAVDCLLKHKVRPTQEDVESAHARLEIIQLTAPGLERVDDLMYPSISDYLRKLSRAQHIYILLRAEFLADNIPNSTPPAVTSPTPTPARTETSQPPLAQRLFNPRDAMQQARQTPTPSTQRPPTAKQGPVLPSVYSPKMASLPALYSKQSQKKDA